MSTDRAFVERGLELLSDFLVEHGQLGEAHLADFIVDDHFERLVPVEVRADFDDHSDGFFRKAFPDKDTRLSGGDGGTCVDEFIKRATDCRLDILLQGDVDRIDFHGDWQLTNLVDIESTLANGCDNVAATADPTEKDDEEDDEAKLLFDPYASQKKQHEVEIMAKLVATICRKQQITQVVDIGSGKGYLCSFLALQHGLNVLGIDSSSSNIINADKRNTRLRKSWDGLVQRAMSRARNEKRRKRNERPPIEEEEQGALSSDEIVLNLKTNFSPRASPAGVFRGISECVDGATDLTALMVENQRTSTDESFVLTGLHTCGNLAARLLERYVGEPNCRAVVSVGCCYHLLDEQFRRSPYENADLSTRSGFPMSSFLKERQFGLGRNSRMLACEALQRILSNQSTPNVTLFYRALLKVILRDKYGSRYDDVRVGRIAKNKPIDFKDYVAKAMIKINVPDKLSDEEISNYLEKYSHCKRQLNEFCRLRSLLAPAIESLILMDRLCYLHEQDDISVARLVRLFDPVISPRCYAIISLKSSRRAIT